MAILDQFKKLFNNEEKEAEEHCQRGRKLFEEGNFGKAEEEWRKAVQLNPSLHQVWTDIGDACAGRGDWPGAVSSYNKSLSLGVKSGRLYSSLACALAATGSQDQALTALKQAVQLSGNDADILIKAIPLYLESASEAEIEELLLKTVKLRPGSSLANFHLGSLYFKNKAIDKALGYFERSTGEKEFRGPAKLKMALIRTLKGDIERALTIIKEALADDHSILRELETSPDFQKVRETKRYAEIMRRLPEAAQVFTLVARAAKGNKTVPENEKRKITAIAMAREPEKAKERVISELAARGWTDVNFESSGMINANSLCHLNAEMQKIYHEAVKKGFDLSVHETRAK